MAEGGGSPPKVPHDMLGTLSDPMDVTGELTPMSPHVFAGSADENGVSTQASPRGPAIAIDASGNSTDVPRNPSAGSAPRVKAYPDTSSGPFVVFFRPKQKRLNIVSIARDLERRYPAVLELTQVRPSKLRLVVSNLKEANRIAADELFTREYRVYVPSHEVEIDGVVTGGGLTVEDLMQEGKGRFKNPSLPSVKILECKQLYSVSLEGGNKTSSLSDQFRVTFAGSALPSFVVMGCARLPVRLYVPRVMNCLKCKQLGHTATYCCNKARCGKCGGDHADDCCNGGVVKCLYCGGNPHDLSTCSAYKLRADKLKRSLKERSKRSFAEMLKSAAPIVSQNPFGPLTDVECDADEPEVGFSFPMLDSNRKRRSTTSPLLPRKELRTAEGCQTRSTVQKTKQVAPGLSNYNQEYPVLPGTSMSQFYQRPTVQNIPQPEAKSSSGVFSLSNIVDQILEALDVPEPLKALLLKLLPFVKTFLKKLTVKWPLIAEIVSLDG